MKRILVVMILLCVLLAGACGTPATIDTSQTSLSTTTTTKAPETTTTAQESTTTTTAAAPAPSEKWGTTIELQGLTITVGAPVDDTAKLSSGQKALVKKGDKVMYVLVTIKNTGDQSYGYTPLDFKLSDSEGFTYDSLGVVCSRPTLDSGDLPPGRTVKGALPFEMPKKSHPSYIDFVRNIAGSIDATWGD
jgi:hypothetical protein